MSWFYSADPSTSPKDAVRFMLGDTVEDAAVTLQDEEINFSIAEVGGSIYRAAANLCGNLAALYVGAAESESKTVGGLELSKTYSDRAKKYENLAKMLETRQRRVNPPMVSADPGSLWAELEIGLFDRYWAIPNDWPSKSVTGVTTTYGTGYSPGDEGYSDYSDGGND